MLTSIKHHTKTNALFLGWASSFSVPESWGPSGFGPAGAFANRLHLYLILPQLNPELQLGNVEAAGLNTIDLQAIQTSVPKPEHFPFADENAVQHPLPLYGTPLATGPEVGYPRQKYPGESIATGTFSNAPAAPTGKGEKQQNLFQPENFSALTISAQVIEYARYTCRLAARKDFDIIHASDWRTYLAGMELKLISGKKLVLQVNPFTDEHRSTGSKGWMYEIEKQAFEKADTILAADAAAAAALEANYSVQRTKIFIAGETTYPHEVNTAALLRSMNLAPSGLVKNTASGKFPLCFRTSGQPAPSRVKVRPQNKWHLHKAIPQTSPVL